MSDIWADFPLICFLVKHSIRTYYCVIDIQYNFFAYNLTEPGVYNYVGAELVATQGGSTPREWGATARVEKRVATPGV